ncbi:MAG TPA: multiheme c-type cytochrome [Bryobacteraceae bacterium]|nr:multiheme c-type cytochrome [Bryobacteraceae bacterium]
MRGLRRIGHTLLIAICLAASVCPAADYVTAAVCGECHKTEYDRQTASRHAHSLQPIQGSIARTAMLRSAQSPDGRLHYEADGNKILVREPGVSEPVTIDWAFGAGAQGITPVGHLAGQYFEHRFSYYSAEEKLGITFGHPPHVNTPLAEIGMPQDNRTIFRCFNCHSTGVRLSVNGPDLAGMEPGVRCERCHGPGSTHVMLARGGAPAEAIAREIVNPGRFPPKVQVEVCGECHRLPTRDMGDEPELENPVTVRFAPIGLSASRCFRASGKLSCLTCHDPHENASKESTSYTNRCLSCHENDRRPVKLCRRLQTANCLPCHMKTVALGRHLRFTDHRIRVY